MAVLRLSVLCLTGAILASAQTGVYQNFRPTVIVPGKTQTVVLEFKTMGIQSGDKVFFERVRPAGPDIEMKDDGTGGDITAGDGVYTVTLDAQAIVNAMTADDIFRVWIGYCKFVRGGVTGSKYLIFAEVAGADVPRIPVVQDAPDAQHTDYVFNVRMPSFFPANAVFGDHAPIGQRFYQYFADKFDQLAIVYVPSYFQNRDHSQLRQDAQGIGTQPTNAAASWGSPNTLVGRTRFPIPSLFDGSDTGFVHEFGHQYIQYLPGPAASGIPHWPISSMATGIMGFSIPPSNEGGEFPCTVTLEAAGLRLKPRPLPPVFTDVDLYLMGLLPPEQVGEHYIFADQTGNVLTQCNNSIYTGAYTKVQLSSLVGNAGTRTPTPATSKKSFRLATIVVSRDALLTAEEMAFYSFFARRGEELGALAYGGGTVKGISYPFFTSTGGRATLRTQLTETAFPQIGFGGVVNGSSGVAATFGPPDVTTGVAPGSYVGIYGSRLGTAAAQATSATLPNTLGGVTVTVNGLSAPLYYSDSGQINIQLPNETKPGLALLRVDVNGVPSNTAYIRVAAGAPGITVFGNNRAAIRNQDQSVNLPDNPAAVGSFISIYFTGIGPLDNPVPTGQPAPLSPLSRATSTCRVTIGNTQVPTQFCGLTPQSTGLAQANVQVPSLPPGDYPVQILIGAVASNLPLMSIGQ
jgi:uncharacterized protein (TIGR03437 family)